METSPPAQPLDLDEFGGSIAPSTNCTVLLVCDDPETLAALQRTAQLEGYRNLSTRHSWEALKVLEQEPIAIVVADQHLPRQTGMELLNNVRERWPGIGRILLLGGVHSDLLGAPIVQWVAHQILEIPWQDWELRLALRQAAEFSTLSQANAQLMAQTRAQSAELQKRASEELPPALPAETLPDPHTPAEREWEAIGRVLAPADLAAPSADLINSLLTQVQKVFKTKAAALALHRPATAENVITAGRGAWAKWAGRAFALNEDLPGYLINARQLVLTDDWRSDSRLAPFSLNADLPAVAGLPLLVPGQVIGALWVGRAAPFAEREGLQLQAVGRVVAQVLDQALRREDMQDRLKRYAAQQASEQILAADLPLDSAMQTLLENLLTHLKVSAAAIWLLDAKGQMLTPVIRVGFQATPLPAPGAPGAGLAGRAVQRREVIYAQRPADEGVAPEEGFVIGLAVPLLARQRLIGAVEVFNRLPLELTSDWVGFLQALAGQIALIIYNLQLLNGLQRAVTELRGANDHILETWANCLELRTPLSEGHLPYLVTLTLRLARALEMSETDLEHLRRGVILHDIGKLLLPDNLLLSDQQFTDTDRRLMRQHPKLAHDLLSPVTFLQPALDIPYCHHEAWDGSGYPRRLKREEIPLAARIFAVVDIWDALRSDRPHRRGWPEGKAIEYIRQQADKQFDPRVVRAFIKLWEDGELLLETTPTLAATR